MGSVPQIMPLILQNIPALARNTPVKLSADRDLNQVLFEAVRPICWSQRMDISGIFSINSLWLMSLGLPVRSVETELSVVFLL